MGSIPSSVLSDVGIIESSSDIARWLESGDKMLGWEAERGICEAQVEEL